MHKGIKNSGITFLFPFMLKMKTWSKESVCRLHWILSKQFYLIFAPPGFILIWWTESFECFLLQVEREAADGQTEPVCWHSCCRWFGLLTCCSTWASLWSFNPGPLSLHTELQICTFLAGWPATNRSWAALRSAACRTWPTPAGSSAPPSRRPGRSAVRRRSLPVSALARSGLTAAGCLLFPRRCSTWSGQGESSVLGVGPGDGRRAEGSASTAEREVKGQS